MRYFIQERKTCYIEADNEEEALHKYYKGEADDVESGVEIVESWVIKMSDADKLFLELGYKLIPQVENRSYFLKYKKDDDNIIYFDEDKEIHKDGEYAETCYGITMQELKAINAKVKELRME